MNPRTRAALEAGLVATIVSSIPGIAWVVASGEPWWRPVQLIATLAGVDRLDAFDPVSFLLGGAMHVAISIAYALVFAMLVRPTTMARSVALGAGYGALIFACNFGLTAALGLADAVRAGTNDAVELVAHLLYGASMAWWLARRLGGSSPVPADGGVSSR